MRWLLISVAVVALVAGCRADVAVTVDVAPDGSGTVAVTVDFDADVVAHVSDLRSQLRLDDVEAAGWVVDEPVELDGGGLRVRATRPVADAAGFASALAEVHPALFPDTELELRRTFATTRYLWRSTVDRSLGVEAFGDPGLTAVLGGELFGLPLDVLTERAGGPLEEMVTVDVAVQLPGGAARSLGAAPLGTSADELRLTDSVADRAALDERSRSERLRNAVPLVLAIGAVWWVVLVGAVWLWRRRR